MGHYLFLTPPQKKTAIGKLKSARRKYLTLQDICKPECIGLIEFNISKKQYF